MIASLLGQENQLDQLIKKVTEFTQQTGSLNQEAVKLLDQIKHLIDQAASTHIGASPLVMGLTVFVLAVFVGYYVVWQVTPALHSPLMSVTNAISSVIIVGAILAAGPVDMTFSKVTGFLAVALASVNIFGGFIVTQRMLGMFRKKDK